MWCPTSLEVNGKETNYPLPEPYLPLTYLNSTGMRYEAEEVRQCLLKGNSSPDSMGGCCTETLHKAAVESPTSLKDLISKAAIYHGLTYGARSLSLPSGLKESTAMSHADSLLLAELEDEIRRQVGVTYSQDCQ